jgi:hypothetical protein
MKKIGRGGIMWFHINLNCNIYRAAYISRLLTEMDETNRQVRYSLMKCTVEVWGAKSSV